MIKTIIFDVGGVLAECSNKILFSNIAKAFNITWDEVYAAVKKLVPEIQAGKISDDEFWKRFSEITGKPLPENHEKLLYEYYEECSPIKQDVLELARELRAKGYQTPILSDTIETHARINWKRLYPEFDPVVLSCEVGMKKPDKRIYELLLKKIKFKPEECVFIDDKPENIKAAEELGMHAMLFKDIKQLKRELKKKEIKF